MKFPETTDPFAFELPPGTIILLAGKPKYLVLELRLTISCSHGVNTYKILNIATQQKFRWACNMHRSNFRDEWEYELPG